MDQMSNKIEHDDDLEREYRTIANSARTELEKPVHENREVTYESHAALDNTLHNHKDILRESSAALTGTKMALGDMYSLNKNDSPNPPYPTTRPIR